MNGIKKITIAAIILLTIDKGRYVVEVIIKKSKNTKQIGGKCDVVTICIGLAASMGAFLLSSGTKGKRYALPNSEIMIHQPLGGAQGQASDIEIQARHIQHIKDKINQILSEATGQDLKKVQKDTDRDYYMTAEQAKEYGLVDDIFYTRKNNKK